MRPISRHALVLGIFPNVRGFAFVLFEGPFALADWGVIRIRHAEKNRACVQRVSQLFGQYQPAVVVLQDMSETGTRRSHRIRDLNAAIEVLAETQDIRTAFYSRAQVRQNAFEDGVVSRQAMAELIAKHIPMLERFVPPIRKRWMTEDPRMALFEAAGLVLAFYRGQLK